jgi:hypothetical protein
MIMEKDELLDQETLFERYFDDALAIRAICDDRRFPVAYSPIFVSIHIQGAEHFRNPELDRELYDTVFDALLPGASEMIGTDPVSGTGTNEYVIDTHIFREGLEEIFIGDEIAEADDRLFRLTGARDYFRNQIANERKMYSDDEFREQMLTLYDFFIKPAIHDYSKEKIDIAFKRGRARDIIEAARSELDDEPSLD